MKFRKFLLTAAGAAAALAMAAVAQPPGPPPGPPGPPHGMGWQHPGPWSQDWTGHGDYDWQDNHGSWHNDHDRYWRHSYHDRVFVDDDVVFNILRHRHYTEFEGRPFWFHGRFIVRTHDRWGRLVMIEVNPYTGAYIGILD